MPHPPTTLGGHALRGWILYHRQQWRDAYWEARRQGFDSEVVIVGSPAGQRIDDPSAQRFGFMTKPQARAMVMGLFHEEFPNPFSTELPDPSYFRCFATCGEGSRFHGSIEVILSLTDSAG